MKRKVLSRVGEKLAEKQVEKPKSAAPTTQPNKAKEKILKALKKLHPMG